ncbi:MAG: DUF4159 domain-containing protein [Bacteroidetes bacterium]|nr:DUF4159 domain-containing protein [Bacteroidota bacterium]
MKKFLLVFLIAFSNFVFAGDPAFKIGLLKYGGGGDWYANLETSLPNLIKFCNDNLGTNINPEQGIVDVGSPELFNYPFVHMTGHGNVIFSESETRNLRNYLVGGGFLHVSDNYGIDVFIRKEMKKVFPELDFVELPFSHPVYHQKYDFNEGPPKIHEHDGKPAQGFGLIYQGRLVCYYDFECDLGDGWEDYEVHKDSPEVHQKALRMGANLIQYAFNQQ